LVIFAKATGKYREEGTSLSTGALSLTGPLENGRYFNRMDPAKRIEIRLPDGQLHLDL
jgi:hypothetical protein